MFTYQFSKPGKPEWAHSVYACVGLVPLGAVVRIGQCRREHLT